jgi:hypothetical protein
MLLPAPTSGTAVATHSHPACTASSKKRGELEGGGGSLVSRPLLRLILGDIGFVYPVMSLVVIGPSLSILR